MNCDDQHKKKGNEDFYHFRSTPAYGIESYQEFFFRMYVDLFPVMG
jgi:hypothetical protein